MHRCKEFYAVIDEWLETYQSTIHLMSLLSITNAYGLDMERYHEGSVFQYLLDLRLDPISRNHFVSTFIHKICRELGFDSKVKRHIHTTTAKVVTLPKRCNFIFFLNIDFTIFFCTSEIRRTTLDFHKYMKLIKSYQKCCVADFYTIF